MQYLYYLILAVCCFFKSSADCGKSPNVQHWKNIFERADNLRHVKYLDSDFSIKGHWPWVVQMFISRNNNKWHQRCTGSIIHPEWILSAKHCSVSNKFSISIGYGEVDAEKMFKKIKITKQYYPGNNQSLNGQDVALFKLEKPLKYGKYVAPICLRRKISEIPGSYEAGVGFGAMHFLHENPNEYDEEITTHCRESYLPIRKIEFGYCDYVQGNDKYEICYGGWNRGPTHGDSGGPAMALINDTWFIHGITSRGAGHDFVLPEDNTMIRKAAIYSDVTAYCDWIADVTQNVVKCQN